LRLWRQDHTTDTNINAGCLLRRITLPNLEPIEAFLQNLSESADSARGITRNVKGTNTRNYYKWQFSLSLLNFRDCMAWVASIWPQLSLFTRFDAPRKDFPFLGASKRVVVVVACHVAVERRSAKEVTKYQYLGMGLHLLFPFLLLPLGIPFSSPPTSKGFRLGLCGGK